MRSFGVRRSGRVTPGACSAAKKMNKSASLRRRQPQRFTAGSQPPVSEESRPIRSAFLVISASARIVLDRRGDHLFDRDRQNVRDLREFKPYPPPVRFGKYPPDRVMTGVF